MQIRKSLHSLEVLASLGLVQAVVEVYSPHHLGLSRPVEGKAQNTWVNHTSAHIQAWVGLTHDPGGRPIFCPLTSKDSNLP